MRLLEHLRFDLRNAVRSLRATPAVTLTALVVLILGIGAGTTIFAVVDAVVLRGLPFPDEARLVSVSEIDLDRGRPTLAAYQNFADWSQRQDVFESLAASALGPWLTTTGDRPRRFRSHRITANLLDVLGVRPAIGHGITADDERTGASVALVSDEMWRRYFDADPFVVGRTVAVDGATYSVAGVMPAGFKYPIGSEAVSAVDLWIPLTPAPRAWVRGNARTYNLRVIGRLKAGVSIEQATARMTQIRDALATETPHWFTDRGIVVRPLKDSVVNGTVRSWMLMLLAAVSGVFLIACANVAKLLLARAAGRRREIGVRAALGATRGQIVRGLVVESVVLALAGAAGGLVLAYWGVDLLRATMPSTLPRVWAIGVDVRVLGVAALTALATGVLCGLLPALQMSRADVSAGPGSGGRSASADGDRQWIRTVFLAAEIALAAVLLVGAGLFGTSFWRVISADLGFESTRVLNVDVSPNFGSDEAGRDEARRFELSMQQALEAIRAIPGVDAAALVAGGAPLTGSSATGSVGVAGRTFTGEDAAVIKQVTPEYFATIGATLLKGRGPRDDDTSGAPRVVVLNDEAARRYLADRDPIGAQISLGEAAPRTVVGVVRGMRVLGLESEIRPEAYVPYAQRAYLGMSAGLVLRTDAEPARLVPSVKEAIWTVMPGLVIPEPQTFDELIDRLVAQRKLNMVLLGLFGALAVLIASIGIYGMLAYLVEQRTKEIGIRMALGAVAGSVLRMVLGRALLPIGAGVVVGLLAAMWLERLVMAFVFRGVPHDPVVYGGAAVLLMALGLSAAFVPARRASRVDPLIALRSD